MPTHSIRAQTSQPVPCISRQRSQPDVEITVVPAAPEHRRGGGGEPDEWRLTTEVQGDSHIGTAGAGGGPPLALWAWYGRRTPVLSIGRLGAASDDYYLAVVASGAEDYYLREGEAPGRWLGPDGGPRPGGPGRGRRPARRPGRPRPARRPSSCAARRGARARPALTSPSRRPSRCRCWARSAIRGRAGRGGRPPTSAAVEAAIGLPRGPRRLPAPRRGRGRARAGRRPGGGGSSPTAPRAPAIRPCTPTCWWPTWPRTTRAASGPSTGARSTATPRPPATSTRPSCATG